MEYVLINNFLSVERTQVGLRWVRGGFMCPSALLMSTWGFQPHELGRATEAVVPSQVQPIQPTPAAAPPAVVIASPAPAVKPSASAPIPITCSETPTVSQLVSSKWLLG